jgi:hypothetical protein
MAQVDEATTYVGAEIAVGLKLEFDEAIVRESRRRGRTLTKAEAHGEAIREWVRKAGREERLQATDHRPEEEKAVDRRL